MYRTVFIACFLLLSGCCSLGSSGERTWAYEDSLDANSNYEAAGEGWENVEEGFSKGFEPTLREGMKASEVKKKLGSPSRKEEGQDRTQWIYSERSLEVFMKDGKVTNWKKQDQGKENT